MLKNRHFLNLLIVSLMFGLFLASSLSVATHPMVFAILIPPAPQLALAQEPTRTASPIPPTATSTVAPTITSTFLPTETPSPTPTTVPFVYALGPSDFPDEVNPLTGLPVEDPGNLVRRPLVIKVTNYPRSVRPQWGLTLADHVYEYYIADSMSRFIGIFYGNDAIRVGPVRSARLLDEHIMRMMARGV